MLDTIGEVTTSVLPLFNVPLILNIRKRKCSCDISLLWTAGIWGCSLVFMIVSLLSGGTLLKAIAVVNFVFFTATMLYILKYHQIKALSNVGEIVVKALYSYGEKAVVETNGERKFINFVD